MFFRIIYMIKLFFLQFSFHLAPYGLKAQKLPAQGNPGHKRNPPCALNQRSPARSGIENRWPKGKAKVKGKSLLKKDIKNENKGRIHSIHRFSCRRTAKHLRHHLPAPLWFCCEKRAPRWQRCRYLCRNAPKVFPDSPSESIP